MSFGVYQLTFLEDSCDWNFIEKRVRFFKYRLFLNKKYLNKSQLKFQQTFGFSNIAISFFSIKTILNCNKALFFYQSSFQQIFYELSQICLYSYQPTFGKGKFSLVLDFCCQIRIFHIFEPEWFVKHKFYFFNCQRNTLFFFIKILQLTILKNF
uniref:Uncharacterized protein n=1 Tax=Codium arenicola TaxID=1191365 RepID=A0A2P0QHZ0_9CHLO|nr:hypothetical protein [Codium arenicola]ARO74375.1 hypothetical protein [Codium arenicola]